MKSDGDERQHLLSTSSEEEEEERTPESRPKFECSVCMEHYDRKEEGESDRTSAVKKAPCGHEFCVHCVAAVISQWGGEFRCPACRQKCTGLAALGVSPDTRLTNERAGLVLVSVDDLDPLPDPQIYLTSERRREFRQGIRKLCTSALVSVLLFPTYALVLDASEIGEAATICAVWHAILWTLWLGKEAAQLMAFAIFPELFREERLTWALAFKLVPMVAAFMRIRGTIAIPEFAVLAMLTIFLVFFVQDAASYFGRCKCPPDHGAGRAAFIRENLGYDGGAARAAFIRENLGYDGGSPVHWNDLVVPE